MRRMLRAMVVAAVAAFVLTLAVPAWANHTHWLELPNGETQVISGGQTSQTSGGGCHQFHDHVHKGQMFTSGTGISPDGPSAVTLQGTAPSDPGAAVPCE